MTKDNAGIPRRQAPWRVHILGVNAKPKQKTRASRVSHFGTLLPMKAVQIAHMRPAATTKPGRATFTTPGLLSSGLVIVGLVAALTVAALWLRVHGLEGWDGTLTVDESRLAMAARGILESGLPRLPSGWVYTRGLLATYLTAPSFALIGMTDFAARLPAILAGTALIPVGYLLGREVGGRLGGLFIAAYLAGHPSLVVWSRQAWFYALYVLIFGAALLFMLRAERTGRARDQVLASACVGLSMFAHEIGIFLIAPLATQAFLGFWRDRRRPGAWVTPLLSMAVVGIAGLVLLLLVTRLRAESLVGAFGEIDEYLSPAGEWPRIRFYLRLLLDGPGLLMLAALAALPLAIRRRSTVTLILWLALIPSFLHAAFLIPRGPQERYGLTLILVMALLGVQGTQMIASAAIEVLGRRRGTVQLTTTAVVGATLAIVLVAHQDVARAVDRAALSPREGAWLRSVRELGIGPDDVVMTDVPTTLGWYVGGLDFWISSRDYEKYTTRSDDLRRDVHTGAVLIRGRADFDRLVGRPLAGQTVWVVSSGRSYQWGELVDDDLKTLIDRTASQRVNPGDNFRVLLINLPSGS